jgi:membrane protease YdiL (CAAX protease family)
MYLDFMNQSEKIRKSIFTFALTVLMLSSAALIFGSLVISTLGLGDNSRRLVSAFWVAAAVSGVAFTLKRWQRLDDQSVGLVSAPFGSVIAACLLGLCLSPLLGLLAAEIRTLVHGSMPNPQVEQLFLSQATHLQWFLLGGFVIIAVPLAEEFLYRGVLFGFISRQASNLTAIWVTAIIFGIAHYDVANSVGTGILGLALGWFRSHTGSIWPSVCLHAAFNTFGFVLIMTPLSSTFGGGGP